MEQRSSGAQVRRADGGLPQPPLVDRQHELAVLVASLDDAAEHAGRALVLQGPAGIGKSRLLAAAASIASERGMRVLRARANQAEREFSFGLILQLLEATVTGLSPDQEIAVYRGSAGLARPLFDGRSDAFLQSPHRLMHGLFWLVVNLAQSGPVLLSVDDLQWGDEPSLRFLAYLAERVEGLPVAFVGATRPPRKLVELPALMDLLSVRNVTPLPVCALTPAGVAEVVRARFAQADSGFCSACTDVTHGNPHYVQEILRSVEGERLPPSAASSDRLRQLGTAATGRASLFRLLSLGPSAIALAHALAVLGNRAQLRLAAQLADLDLDTAAAAADLAVAEGILRGENAVFDFAHPLIGELVAAEVTPTQRGLMHRRAARLLRDHSGLPEVTAGHLLASPAGGEQWAVDALRDAATRASKLGTSDVAVRFLQRALDEGAITQDRAELLTQLGQVETAAAVGNPVEHLTEALSLHSDPVARTQVSRILARALVSKGYRRDAALVLEAAIDSAAGRESALQRGLVLDYLLTCMFEEGLRQSALDQVAPLLAHTPPEATAESRAILAVLAMRAGQEARPAEAITLADEAWSGGQLLLDCGPDGAPWLMATWACALAEDYERMTAMCSAAIDAARKLGSATGFVTASYFRGFSHFYRGQLVPAAADVDPAMLPVGVEGNGYVRAAAGLHAVILVEHGELEAAEAAFDRGAPSPQGQLFEIVSNLHAQGYLRAARGDHAVALKLFVESGRMLSEQLGVDHTVIPWRFHGALSAIQLGDVARAEQLVQPMLDQARVAGLRIHEARGSRILGLVERGSSGILHLRKAVECYAATQATLEHAYAIADLGAALRRAGLRSEATQHLRVALDMTARMQAGRLSARVRTELAAAGARPRREAIHGPASLTPTESRVAELVAQGLTNLQAAQALFVTPKTIEYHLLHIYRKLDVRRRAELSAALASSA